MLRGVLAGARRLVSPVYFSLLALRLLLVAAVDPREFASAARRVALEDGRLVRRTTAEDGHQTVSLNHQGAISLVRSGKDTLEEPVSAVIHRTEQKPRFPARDAAAVTFDATLQTPLAASTVQEVAELAPRHPSASETNENWQFRVPASQALVGSSLEVQAAASAATGGGLLKMRRATAGKAAEQRSCREISDELLKWAKKYGVRGVDKLEISEFKRGPAGRVVRSLTPRTPVMKGDVVLSVPAELIVYSSGERSLKRLRNLFMDSGIPVSALDSPSHQLRLTVALLALHGFSSDNWDGYFQSLPSQAELRQSHPTEASPGLLWTFRDLPVVEKIKQQQTRRAKDLEYFWSIGGRVSPEDWEWADVTVSSRTWAGPRGSSEGLMLVPVADFVSSGLESEQNLRTRLGDPEKNEPFELIAAMDIAPGVELVDYYGAASDELWVQSWGMVLPGNAERFAVAALDQKACSQLSEAVGPAIGGDDQTCRAPEAQPQKEAFCTLARLSVEHCRDFGPLPCRDNLCLKATGIIGDIQRVNAQRPWLLRALVLLFCLLFFIRFANLLQLKPLRLDHSRPARRRWSTSSGASGRESPASLEGRAAEKRNKASSDVDDDACSSCTTASTQRQPPHK